MKIIKTLFFGLILLFLIMGCAKNNAGIAYQDHNYKNKISNAGVIFLRDSSFKIMYTQGSVSKEKKKALCKKQIKEFENVFLNKLALIDELKARGITFKSFGNKSDVIFVVRPVQYLSSGDALCKPTRIKFQIKIVDIKKLSKNWDGKVTSEKIKKLRELENKKVIWSNEYTWRYSSIPFSNDESIDLKMNAFVINDLEKSQLLPKRIMEIKQAIALNAKKYKENQLIRKEQQKLQVQNNDIQKLSYIGCSQIEDPLSFGYSKKSKAMCLGNLSFVNVKSSASRKWLTMLNGTSGQHMFKLENSTCPGLAISHAIASKEDENASFKLSYKQQVLKHFNNHCSVDHISGINFLACGKKEKNYFMELSFKDNQRIYKKSMVQMEQMCFEKFKKYMNKEKLDVSWRTKHGYNQKGFNYEGHNVMTDSEYDSKGFDYNGWNKNGIHKLTGTKYNDEGIDINGLYQDGTDKDGWNARLKKFIKPKSEVYPYGFKVVQLKSQMKNKVFNRTFYDDLYYKKVENGFYLVGKKIYGTKTMPKKIELYYYRSAKGKIIDFKGSKKALLQEKLVLEKKVTKVYDKNGYDQEGYDKDGWNKKLQKFRHQIKNK
jgi:hypothetical protein